MAKVSWEGVEMFLLPVSSLSFLLSFFLSLSKSLSSPLLSIFSLSLGDDTK